MEERVRGATKTSNKSARAFSFFLSGAWIALAGWTYIVLIYFVVKVIQIRALAAEDVFDGMEEAMLPLIGIVCCAMVILPFAVVAATHMALHFAETWRDDKIHSTP